MILSRRRSKARPPGDRHASRSAGHAVKLVPALAVGVTLTVAAAACSSGSSSASGAAHTSAPAPPRSAAASSSAAMSTLGAHSLPAQTSQTLPAFPAYYDAHKDVVVVSDAYPKAAAGTFHANYAPSLSAVLPASPAGLVHRPRPRRTRPDRRAGVRARGKRLLAAVADGDRPVEARRHPPGADQRQHDPRPGQERPAHRHENSHGGELHGHRGEGHAGIVGRGPGEHARRGEPARADQPDPARVPGLL